MEARTNTDSSHSAPQDAADGGCVTPLRLTIVGPLHPHSGGIANHTTELADELERRAVVQRISYRVLYPKLLYPGEYRAKVDATGAADSPYLLHYGNPLTWLRAARRIRRFKPDAVIMTWWTFFLTPVNRILVTLLRRHRIPVFFICHNVFDHEGHPLKALCSRSVLKHANGCIVHAEPEKNKIASFASAMPVLKTPLFCSRAEGDTADLPVVAHKPLRLLFFGYVRPYKGLADLATALPLIGELDIELAVVGEWWNTQPELRDALLSTRIKVTIADQFVSDSDKRTWFEWADGVILPYRSATASGVVAEAYNHGKPVITTAVGGIPEVVVEGQTGFLAEAANPQSLADAIQRFHAAVNAGTNFQPPLAAMRKSLEVGHYADKLVEFIAASAFTPPQDSAGAS